MNRTSPRRAGILFCASTLLIAMALQSACGTIFYPERRGQPRGELDVGVVLLNGIGLLFFLIPGIIAYAVDFSTGAIYLPASDEGGIDTSQAPDLMLSPEDMSTERIAQLLSERTGRAVTEEDVRAATGLVAIAPTK